MISIPRPADDAVHVYRACAKRTRDISLKISLLNESQRVGVRSTQYLTQAPLGELYSIVAEAPVNVTSEQMSQLYDRVLVGGGERDIYDRLQSAARFRRCPLCGQRDVKTLDHYLPKSLFPEFAVFPSNLVPCCSDCNKAKHDHQPTSPAEQTFHPYFDNWDGHEILIATVNIAARVEVRFSIIKSPTFSPEYFVRAQHHFQLLDLGALYAAHAALELVQKKSDFRKTYTAGGSEELRQELRFEADSRSTPFPNAWQPALYRSLASSCEFCAGGFENIEE